MVKSAEEYLTRFSTFRTSDMLWRGHSHRRGGGALILTIFFKDVTWSDDE